MDTIIQVLWGAELSAVVLFISLLPTLLNQKEKYYLGVSLLDYTIKHKLCLKEFFNSLMYKNIYFIIILVIIYILRTFDDILLSFIVFGLFILLLVQMSKVLIDILKKSFYIFNLQYNSEIKEEISNEVKKIICGYINTICYAKKEGSKGDIKSRCINLAMYMANITQHLENNINDIEECIDILINIEDNKYNHVEQFLNTLNENPNISTENFVYAVKYVFENLELLKKNNTKTFYLRQTVINTLKKNNTDNELNPIIKRLENNK